MLLLIIIIIITLTIAIYYRACNLWKVNRQELLDGPSFFNGSEGSILKNLSEWLEIIDFLVKMTKYATPSWMK